MLILSTRSEISPNYCTLSMVLNAEYHTLD